MENKFPGLLFGDIEFRCYLPIATKQIALRQQIFWILSRNDSKLKFQFPPEKLIPKSCFDPTQLRIISNIYLNHRILSGRPRIQSPWEPPITDGMELRFDNRKMFVVLTNYLAASSSLRGIGIYWLNSVVFPTKTIFLVKSNKHFHCQHPRDGNLWPMFVCHSQTLNIYLSQLNLLTESLFGSFFSDFVSRRRRGPCPSDFCRRNLFFYKNGNIKKLIITFRLVCRHLVDDRDTRSEGDEK